MLSLQPENTVIRFPCLLKTMPKKDIPAGVFLRHLLMRGSACEHQQTKSLHRRANGHLKVTDSSGPGPAWVTDFMSSATALTYSSKCISLPPRQGDSSSHSPCMKCFPTWQVEPSSPICRSRKSTGPIATCHSFLVTTGQSPQNISAYIIAATLWLQASSCSWTLCVYASTVMRLASK